MREEWELDIEEREKEETEKRKKELQGKTRI